LRISPALMADIMSCRCSPSPASNKYVVLPIRKLLPISSKYGELSGPFRGNKLQSPCLLLLSALLHQGQDVRICGAKSD
jgi:hypothetical protein